MAIERPYRRNCRPLVSGRYNTDYVTHEKFARSPAHYVRAFMLLQKDLIELFDFIEPAEDNLSCYSYRIHALLLRACVEVEANCKAILTENGYPKKSSDLNMTDYKMIEPTHHLSSFQIQLPYWSGEGRTRRPFQSWATAKSLPWYEAYNVSKHSRQVEFQQATFANLIDACCGVLAVLSAQFGENDFSPGPGALLWEGPDDGMETGIGKYFRVKFPDDWPIEERYEFDWEILKKEPDPFQNFPYKNAH